MTRPLSIYAPSVQSVLGCLEYYINTCGYSPTQREIAEFTGYQPSTIHCAVVALEKHELIRRIPHRRRNLELIEQEVTLNFKLYRVGPGKYRLYHEAVGGGDEDIMIELDADGKATFIRPGAEHKRLMIANLGLLLVTLYEDRLKASEA